MCGNRFSVEIFILKMFFSPKLTLKILKFEKNILETGTSNLLFVKKNKIYSPTNDFYKGTTLRFFSRKLKKIIKKSIPIDSLNDYDEIIVIGSGKGVVSVSHIKEPYWKRKSL